MQARQINFDIKPSKNITERKYSFVEQLNFKKLSREISDSK
jgi:hypothetical protein